MQKLDVTEFLRLVLAKVDNLPDGFDQKLADLATSRPTTRAAKIRTLIEEVTRG